MKLEAILRDLLDGILQVDASGIPFRGFQPGVGPYGEPQLVKLLVQHLNSLPSYMKAVRTRRSPDILIPGEWGIEVKITRPFGDNANEAENWSVNLLHPYPGNVSTIGDCLKLLSLNGRERKSIVVIGYEHIPPQIDLSPLIRAFEVIANQVAGIILSSRIELKREGLIHPVHQSVRLFGWEVVSYAA